MAVLASTYLTMTLYRELSDQLCAQSSELLVGDRPRFFEPIKLFNLVGSAETHHTPQFLACLRSLLAASFGHASRLSDQVCEYAEIGEHDQGYHPDCLDPAGNVMTPEQVAYDDNEEPEPQDEHEDGEGVGQEIAESEAFREEEHCDSPCSGNRPVAGVASGLCIFCCLRHTSDPCRGNPCPPPSIGQRPHAFARRVTSRRASRKLSRAAHGQRAAGRFDMRGSRLELVHAADLLAHAFERRGEHLL